MRKDQQAVDQWSPALVSQCATLQRQILADVWPALKTGGLLVYSTCTFNREENEQILDYIADTLGAESVAVPIDEAWGISAGIDTRHHCYRFMPHRTRGEGLFMAVMRKTGGNGERTTRHRDNRRQRIDKTLVNATQSWLTHPAEYTLTVVDGTLMALPTAHSDLLTEMVGTVRTLQAGVPLLATDARKPIPHPALAYNLATQHDAWPLATVDYDTAIDYLRGNAITLADAPRGIVLVAYDGAPLGFANNLGSRANNLYPKPWRIISPHRPTIAPSIIKA